MHHKLFTHSHTHTLTSRTLSHINKLPHIISGYYNTNSSKLKKNDSLTYKIYRPYAHQTKNRIGIHTLYIHVSNYVPQINKNMTILPQ